MLDCHNLARRFFAVVVLCHSWFAQQREIFGFVSDHSHLAFPTAGVVVRNESSGARSGVGYRGAFHSLPFESEYGPEILGAGCQTVRQTDVRFTVSFDCHGCEENSSLNSWLGLPVEQLGCSTVLRPLQSHAAFADARE
jgi:hypothetical protein